MDTIKISSSAFRDLLSVAEKYAALVSTTTPHPTSAPYTSAPTSLAPPTDINSVSLLSQNSPQNYEDLFVPTPAGILRDVSSFEFVGKFVAKGAFLHCSETIGGAVRVGRDRLSLLSDSDGDRLVEVSYSSILAPGPKFLNHKSFEIPTKLGTLHLALCTQYVSDADIIPTIMYCLLHKWNVTVTAKKIRTIMTPRSVPLLTPVTIDERNAPPTNTIVQRAAAVFLTPSKPSTGMTLQQPQPPPIPTGGGGGGALGNQTPLRNLPPPILPVSAPVPGTSRRVEFGMLSPSAGSRPTANTSTALSVQKSISPLKSQPHSTKSISPVKNQISFDDTSQNFVDMNFAIEDQLPWFQSRLNAPITYTRLQRLFPNASLFSNQPVDLTTVSSGFLHDGWIVVLLRALLLHNVHHVHMMFPNASSESTPGKYTVRVHLDGSWRTIDVDDTVPVLRMADGKLVSCLTTLPTGDMWLPLLIKAIAKYHGSFEALERANPAQVLADLSGGVYAVNMGSVELSSVAHHQQSRNVILATSKAQDPWSLASVVEVQTVQQGQSMARVATLNGYQWMTNQEYCAAMHKTDVVSLFTNWNEASLQNVVTYANSHKYILQASEFGEVVVCALRRDNRFSTFKTPVSSASMIVSVGGSRAQGTALPGSAVLVSFDAKVGCPYVVEISITSPETMNVVPVEYILRILSSKEFTLTPAT
eukprot:PhF_6_TR14892/c0_g1_i1/m.23223